MAARKTRGYSEIENVGYCHSENTRKMSRNACGKRRIQKLLQGNKEGRAGSSRKVASVVVLDHNLK